MCNAFPVSITSLSCKVVLSVQPHLQFTPSYTTLLQLAIVLVSPGPAHHSQATKLLGHFSCYLGLTRLPVFRWLRLANWLYKGYSSTISTTHLLSRMSLGTCQWTPPLQPPAPPRPMNCAPLWLMKRHGSSIGIAPCLRCATKGEGQLYMLWGRPLLPKVPCLSTRLPMCSGRCKMLKLSALLGNGLMLSCHDLHLSKVGAGCDAALLLMVLSVGPHTSPVAWHHIL